MLKLILSFSLSVVILTINYKAFAANVVPSDKDYFHIRQDNYMYIYPDEFKFIIPELVHYNQFFKKEYEASFQWVLDEETDLLITSLNNQIMNANARVTPNNLTIFYSGGVGSLESSAERSWMGTLVAHETAHLYQLNTKHGIAKWAKKLFGNPIFIPIYFPLFFFIHPNNFTPTYLVEGNATFNESRFGLGGRLFSGEVKALNFALLKAEKINPSYMINDSFDFPYGQEKYTIGALFQYYLSTKYGVDKVNQFFLTQSRRYINPFVVYHTFKTHFGDNFYDLFEEFLGNYTQLASQQVAINRPAIKKSKFRWPMTRVGQNVYFITQNGYNHNELNIFNLLSSELTTQKTTLPRGQIFLDQDKLYSQTFSIVDMEGIKIINGLYDSEKLLHPKYHSMEITDLQKDNRLSFSLHDSMNEPHLYLNDEFYDISHSKAIFGKDGQIYYFKQDKDKRVLIKNKKPIYSFKGFYSKVIDTGSDGSVYFIASTEFGSSLFRFLNGQVHRINSSDRIVDAKHFENGMFLVCEVTADGFEYKQTSSDIITQALPYYEKYEFINDGEFTTFFEPVSKEVLSQIKLPAVTEYNSLTELRFNSLIPFVIITIDEEDESSSDDSSKIEVLGSLSISFSDPLAYNTVTSSYIRGSDERDQFLFSYNNTKHRLEWNFNYSYDEDIILSSVTGEIVEVIPENTVSVGTSYLLMKRGYWSSGLNTDLTWEKVSKNAELVEQTYPSIGIDLSYSIRAPLAYKSIQNFNTSLDFIEFDSGSAYIAEASLGHSIGRENYFNYSLNYGVAQENDLEILESNPFVVGYNRIGFPSVSLEKDILAKEIQNVSLKYQKVFHTPIYNEWFFLGLRRTSPFARARYYNYKTDSSDTYIDFAEWSVGIDIEVLFSHSLPFIISVEGGDNNLPDSSKNYSLIFKSKTDF